MFRSFYTCVSSIEEFSAPKFTSYLAQSLYKPQKKAELQTRCFPFDSGAEWHPLWMVRQPTSVLHYANVHLRKPVRDAVTRMDPNAGSFSFRRAERSCFG